MPSTLTLRHTLIGGETAPDDYAVIEDGRAILPARQSDAPGFAKSY